MPVCTHASPVQLCMTAMIRRSPDSRKLLYIALLMISSTDSAPTSALAVLVLASGGLWCVRAVLLQQLTVVHAVAAGVQRALAHGHRIAGLLPHRNCPRLTVVLPALLCGFLLLSCLQKAKLLLAFCGAGDVV